MVRRRSGETVRLRVCDALTTRPLRAHSNATVTSIATATATVTFSEKTPSLNNAIRQHGGRQRETKNARSGDCARKRRRRHKRFRARTRTHKRGGKRVLANGNHIITCWQRVRRKQAFTRGPCDLQRDKRRDARSSRNLLKCTRHKSAHASGLGQLIFAPLHSCDFAI